MGRAALDRQSGGMPRLDRSLETLNKLWSVHICGFPCSPQRTTDAGEYYYFWLPVTNGYCEGCSTLFVRLRSITQLSIGDIPLSQVSRLHLTGG